MQEHLKEIRLNNKGVAKFLRGEKIFFKKDFDSSFDHFTIGEWLSFDVGQNYRYLGFCSPFSQVGFYIQIAWEIKDEKSLNISQKILSLIQLAIERRKLLIEDFPCCRLVYGSYDLLPGLIVDAFESHILVTINSTGLDFYREHILTVLSSIFPQHQLVYRENKKYREREGLPFYKEDEILDELVARENQLLITIKQDIIQKNGFYYDHRMNRKFLFSLLPKFQFKVGLDLFSYVGAWGLGLLKNGLTHVDFVDQGRMEKSILKSVNKNDLNNNGKVYRGSVFDFLNKAKPRSYDIVCCDPPAFAKDSKNKKDALRGYRKLLKGILPILNDHSMLVFSSCTKYVSYSDLDSLISNYLDSQKLSYQLLFNGIQDYDHPIKSLDDDNNYIKCLIYFIEKEENELSGKNSSST